MKRTGKGIKAPDSSIAILRLLDSEGYSEHAANVLKRYWRRAIMHKETAYRTERTTRAFTEMVKAKLSDTDRIVLGKMMSLQARMNFDVGLRMGLSARIAEPILDEDGEFKQ